MSAPTLLIDEIMDYETGEMSQEEMIAFFQKLMNTGVVFYLQGSYQRTAEALAQQGLITKPEYFFPRKQSNAQPS